MSKVLWSSSFEGDGGHDSARGLVGTGALRLPARSRLAWTDAADDDESEAVVGDGASIDA